ncbi:Zinc finger CCCH domain-containing protein 24 [Heracleum sosnowskyi]|uniref:Zinc finger CCCH domain-containing protein 24 n=1 Tax=Heracleum sosnowskyi TaxID=360622 RepID=A0AAD8N8G4_9APIA|nr:Zinc finger CCCH domain-containing protein 24 [Heracleum sosnowskyi]
MNGHDSISDQPLISPPSPPSKPDPEPEPQPEFESIQPPAPTTLPVPEPGEKRKQPEPDSDPIAPPPEKSKHPLWKTSLCSYFRRTGGECSHGETCRYAHSEEELRQRPDNTWDPTSERGKKMKNENGEGVEVKRGGDEVLITEAVGDDCGSNDVLEKCLVNLPMKWSSDNLRTFLTDNGITFKSAKKRKGMLVGFVSFETAEQVKSAVQELKGKSFGNKNLKIADATPRTFEKRKQGEVPLPLSTQHTTSENFAVSKSSVGVDDGDSIDDNITPESTVSKSRSARDVVTPLAHMSYVDQLEHKKSSLAQMLKKLTRNARKASPNGVSLPEWILNSREIGGLPCKLEGIVESPVVNGYRNKCEFSVGYSLQGKVTVGFSLGNFREGVIAVDEPLNCPNVSGVACKYSAIFQEFLQHSELPIWNRLNNTGFWRQLTVREGRKPGKSTEVEDPEAHIAEVLLMVQVSTAGFDDGVVNGEFGKMTKAFVIGASANTPPLPLTALLIQDHTGISNVAPADAPLRSLPIQNEENETRPEVEKDVVEARIHDYISNLQFCISATAFFQVNTLAAEKLYSLAGDWAGLGPDTLLFDICCGTGTIGLTLAHRVGMVVGIEMNASAVSDAIRNAEINGITNCRFVCSKAEDVLGSLLKEYINVPQKPDISQVSVINDDVTVDEKVSLAENETDTLTENETDTENNLIMGLENCEDATKCITNEGQEGDSHQSCSAASAKSVQHFKNVVAIVDPPRVGLHPTVIKALRTHPHLRRLVYISCNPESLVANAIELCTPSVDKTEKGNKNNRGWRNMSSAGLARHRAKSMPNSEPFQPIKAMAVDLFPHTPHCELVMLLER